MTNKKPKCMIVYTANAWPQAGGVQKIVCSLASALVDRGWAVTIVTETKNQDGPFYPIHTSVRLIQALPKWMFALGKTIRKRLSRLFYRPLMKREQPDVVLCASWNDLERVPTGFPTVLMQHIPPRIALKKTKKKSVRNRYLNLLKHTACVQVLLPSFEREIHRFDPTVRVECIGNPVPELPAQTAPAESHTPTVLCIGRLEPNKNQLVLIQAFEKVHRQKPDIRLILCGMDGNTDYADACRDEVVRNNLTGAVSFIPSKKNIIDLYKTADIYVSPSLFEGWGLTVTEAMSAGLPVVGLKTADGVNALVQDGVTGILTDNDPDSFAEALLNLLHSPETRTRLGRAGRVAVADFAPEKVWAKWDTLLRSIAFPADNAKKG